MRWHGLIVIFAVVTTLLADPEPKKFKPESKDKSVSTALTDEERKFLREVEAKFGIKSEIPIEKEEKEDKDLSEKKEDNEDKPVFKPPFPAVIAIEIVNDTDSDGKPSKGKRTIDANLGYGYRTNNGYSYTYFGNPSHEKGKYMIYPYSQEDIPPRTSEGQQVASEVEIQPSQAFELVPVKNEEQTSYEYKKPQTEFKTKYENVQGLHAPPPRYPENTHNSQTPSSILYTTYNGEKFSGLQSNFPKVMPNYLVEPSQLLQNSQYQSAGLTKDYLQSHGQQLQQRVVPVLVLRIPSSYLKNPSAELYSNSPQNYPLSNYLTSNNADLQQLVNQYFKKIGYPFAPQIMSYPNSSPLAQTHASSISNYEPQHYAHPYVQPSYTHSDYSGLEYSAVQPVMAKYPGLQNYYKQQQQHTSQSHPLYQQPLRQQNYEYRYQYMHQPASMSPSSYYVQQQYQTPQAASYDQSVVQTNPHEENAHDAASNAEYESPQQQYSSQVSSDVSAYETPKYQNVQQYEEPSASVAPEYENPEHTYAEYGVPKGDKLELNSGEVVAQDVDPTKVSIASSYESPQQASQYSQELTHTQSYYTQHSGQPVQKETKTITIYPSSQPGQATKYIVRPESGSVQSYVYQKHVGEDSASQSLVISENYPSKDHTQAHTDNNPVNKPITETQQTISYVTPIPHKYKSKYQVMVPQTVFKNPERISYVNSHSLPMHYTLRSETNPEEEYTVSHQHIPPVGSQKPSDYPKNYHSHKRMTNKNDSKQDNAKAVKKEFTQKSA